MAISRHTGITSSDTFKEKDGKNQQQPWLGHSISDRKSKNPICFQKALDQKKSVVCDVWRIALGLCLLAQRSTLNRKGTPEMVRITVSLLPRKQSELLQ